MLNTVDICLDQNILDILENKKRFTVDSHRSLVQLHCKRRNRQRLSVNLLTILNIKIFKIIHFPVGMMGMSLVVMIHLALHRFSSQTIETSNEHNSLVENDCSKVPFFVSKMLLDRDIIHWINEDLELLPQLSKHAGDVTEISLSVEVFRLL